MLEALSYGFMQKALMAGLLASLACGVIGALVVVNRIVFIAGGIAHAAYGGVGLAFYLGWPVLPCTMGFTLAASSIMAAVTVDRPHRADTVVGVLWAAGMALGILLVDQTRGYHVDLMSYLFGSILTVPASDLWLMAGLDIFILAVTLTFYKAFAAMSYDYEFARIRNVPVRVLHFLMLAMIACSVVMIIRVVGLILVIALITIPPYIAEQWSRSLIGVMAFSALLCAFFTLAGLWLSYVFNLTSGASIIAVAVVAFFVLPFFGRIAAGVKNIRAA